MSNTIKPKRSYAAGVAPAVTGTPEIQQHELAINWTDQKIYTRNSQDQLVTISLGGETGPAGSFGDPQTITQKSASYTLALADVGTLLTFSGSSSMTLTVPVASSVAWVAGSHIDVARLGSGSLTVSPASGVTVTATPGLSLRANGSAGTLVYLGSNAWLLVGDLA